MMREFAVGAHDGGRPTSGVNWTIASTQASSARRRSYIALSSISAQLSSAGRRRQRGLDIDEREGRALEFMRDELKRTAQSLRTGGESTVASPEQTFAFSQLAAVVPEGIRPTDIRDPNAVAEALDRIAAELEQVLIWDSQDNGVAARVATVFEELSRILLQQVSSTGETLGRGTATPA